MVILLQIATKTPSANNVTVQYGTKIMQLCQTFGCDQTKSWVAPILHDVKLKLESKSTFWNPN